MSALNDELDYQILKLLQKNKNAIIIGSLGTISNDLENIPHPNKILIRGAMGCSIGVGLGYALASKKKVIVIIGEGSFGRVFTYLPKQDLGVDISALVLMFRGLSRNMTWTSSRQNLIISFSSANQPKSQ